MRKRQFNNGLLSFGGSIAMIQGLRKGMMQILPRGNNWYFQLANDTDNNARIDHTHGGHSLLDDEDLLTPEQITGFLIDTIQVIEDRTLEKRYVSDWIYHLKQWAEELDNKWLALILFLCLFITPLVYTLNKLIRIAFGGNHDDVNKKANDPTLQNARHPTPPSNKQQETKQEKNEVEEQEERKEKEFINQKPEFIIVSDGEIDDTDNELDNNIIKTINDSFRDSFFGTSKETLDDTNFLNASKIDILADSSKNPSLSSVAEIDNNDNITSELERIIEESIDSNIQSILDENILDTNLITDDLKVLESDDNAGLKNNIEEKYSAKNDQVSSNQAEPVLSSEVEQSNVDQNDKKMHSSEEIENFNATEDIESKLENSEEAAEDIIEEKFEEDRAESMAENAYNYISFDHKFKPATQDDSEILKTDDNEKREQEQEISENEKEDQNKRNIEIPPMAKKRRSVLSELMIEERQNKQTDGNQTPAENQNFDLTSNNNEFAPTDENNNITRSEPIQIGKSNSVKPNSLNSILVPNLSSNSAGNKNFIQYSPTKHSGMQLSVDTNNAYSQPFTF